MKIKKYYPFRIVITIFVSAIVLLAIASNDYLLSIVGVIVGLLFIAFVRIKANNGVDEREVTIQEKAAHLTYAIFAPTIGIGALLLLILSRSKLPVFANAEFAYLESLGVILAYLTLFLISVYAISHHFLSKQYGGSKDEE